jgi:protein dithiol oxidoreductase (disulfide-forming)
MKKLVIFLVLMISPLLVQADNFKAGVNYKELEPQPTQTGDKIEVLEFFWYGCPHCYHFEPYISAWKKTMPDNVEFIRVPAIFRPDWEIQAKAYYALSVMGVIEDLHGKIFDAIHKDKKPLNTLDAIADFVAQNGVDKKTFLSEYNSFVVDSMTRKAKKKMLAYHIEGVPSIVVNGKYLTTGSMAGSYENLVKVIDWLVAKESKKQAK